LDGTRGNPPRSPASSLCAAGSIAGALRTSCTLSALDVGGTIVERERDEPPALALGAT
jgi:hypothetical protein